MKRLTALLLALLLMLTAIPVFAEKLTDEPVTFTIWMPEKSSLRDPVNTFLWDWIYEQTGVKFEVESYSSFEQLQLMFANREFPDMLGGSYVTGMLGSIQTAGMDGDMVDLLTVFDQYCPTWKKIYEQNPTLKNGAMIDGHLYTLPAQLQTPLGSIRDQWIYIPSWLKEIGMEVPATMDELTDVLVAIKNAAGTGTIPENVCPLYFYYDNTVGGQFDIYAAFGVETGCNDQYLMADADGKLVYQAINPDIKAALKWIQNCVKLGLVPMECFTDDWNTYLSRVASKPAYVYMFTAYANQQPELGMPMPVPENGLGLPNYIRPQSTQGGNPLHTFCVFNTDNVKNNMETLGKWLEWAAQPEYALTSYFGKEGLAWFRNEDGTISLSTQLYNNEWVAANFLDLGPDNAFFAVLTKEFYDTQYYDPETVIEGTRAWSIENFYKACLPEWDAFVYSTTLDEEDTFRQGELLSVLRTYRRETMTRWLTTDADIDAEWDAYVAKMEELGVQDWLALKQKAYDKATGR